MDWVSILAWFARYPVTLRGFARDFSGDVFMLPNAEPFAPKQQRWGHNWWFRAMSHPPLEQLCSGVHMDLSENVVPLNPLLCHHFPYQIAILWDSMGISHFQTNPYKHVGANQHVQPKVRNRLYPIQYPGFLGQPCLLLEGLTGLFLCFLRCCRGVLCSEASDAITGDQHCSQTLQLTFKSKYSWK